MDKDKFFFNPQYCAKASNGPSWRIQLLYSFFFQLSVQSKSPNPPTRTLVRILLENGANPDLQCMNYQGYQTTARQVATQGAVAEYLNAASARVKKANAGATRTKAKTVLEDLTGSLRRQPELVAMLKKSDAVRSRMEQEETTFDRDKAKAKAKIEEMTRQRDQLNEQIEKQKTHLEKLNNKHTFMMLYLSSSADFLPAKCHREAEEELEAVRQLRRELARLTVEEKEEEAGDGKEIMEAD